MVGVRFIVMASLLDDGRITITIIRRLEKKREGEYYSDDAKREEKNKVV